MEVVFKQPCVAGVAKVHVNQFVRDEEKALVEQIVRMFSTHLASLDAISTCGDEQATKKLLGLVDSVINEQINLAKASYTKALVEEAFKHDNKS